MGVSNQRFGGERRSGTLVVFPGALGDFVCFAGALAHLGLRDGRAPTLLVKGSIVPLARALGLGDALALEGPHGAWLFSGAPPPEAEAFFGGFTAIECFTGSGVAEVEENVARWTGARGGVHPFRPTRPVHLAVHFLERVGGAETGSPRWTVPERLAEEGLRLLPRGSNAAAPVVVQPGSGGVGKRWSREGFRRVAAGLAAERRPVLVVLGPAEEAEAPWWRERAPAVVESPPLDVLAGLLSRAACCLGNDSGTSHLAAVVGAPGVSLFGPTDPSLWRPWSRRWEALRLDPWSGVDDGPDERALAVVEGALRARLTG